MQDEKRILNSFENNVGVGHYSLVSGLFDLNIDRISRLDLELDLASKQNTKIFTNSLTIEP